MSNDSKIFMIQAVYNEQKSLYGLFNKLQERKYLDFLDIIGEKNENSPINVNQLINDD